MTDKELHGLKRTDLLKILIEQEKELETMRVELDATRKKLENRKIQLEKAGNIAEAALQINGVFQTAQAAAKQYLDNIKEMSDQQQKICSEKQKSVKERCALLEKETKAKCKAMEEETRRKCSFIEEDTRKKCETIKDETDKEIEKHWSELSEKLEAFYDAHKGLRKLVTVTSEIQSE